MAFGCKRLHSVSVIPMIVTKFDSGSPFYFWCFSYYIVNYNLGIHSGVCSMTSFFGTNEECDFIYLLIIILNLCFLELYDINSCLILLTKR